MKHLSGGESLFMRWDQTSEGPKTKRERIDCPVVEGPALRTESFLRSCMVLLVTVRMSHLQSGALPKEL